MSDSLDYRVQCRKNNISSQLTTQCSYIRGNCASERVWEGKEGRRGGGGGGGGEGGRGGEVWGGEGGGKKSEGNRLELFIVSVFGSEIDSFSF